MSDNDIFGEGWREPSDDTERAWVYFLLVLAIPAGIAIFIYGLIYTIQNKFGFGTVMFCGFGGGIAVASSAFLVKESRHWNLRQMSTERFVAGGFLFGLTLMGGSGLLMRGVGRTRYMHQGSNFEGLSSLVMILFGLGIADLIIFLFLGLFFAYLPQLMPSKHLPNVTILRRFAQAGTEQIDDHPCPWEDGFKPMVEVMMPTRSIVEYNVTAGAYRRAEAIATGKPIVEGRKIVGFSVPNTNEIARRK